MFEYEVPQFYSNYMPIRFKGPEEMYVMGRELHEKLGAKSEYRKWFSKVKTGYREGIDYKSINDNSSGHVVLNHELSFKMAMNIGLTQLTPQGEDIREKLTEFVNETIILGLSLETDNEAFSALVYENADLKKEVLNLKEEVRSLKREIASWEAIPFLDEKKIPELDLSDLYDDDPDWWKN